MIGVAYAGKILSALNKSEDFVSSISYVKSSESIWDKGWAIRGQKVDELLVNNLGRTFPIVDKIDRTTKVVTSVKSYDIVNSYQKAGSWLKQMRQDIRKLNGLKGETTGIGTDGLQVTIKEGEDYTSKALEVAISKTELTIGQIEALKSAASYAKTFNIDFHLVIINDSSYW